MVIISFETSNMMNIERQLFNKKTQIIYVRFVARHRYTD